MMMMIMMMMIVSVFVNVAIKKVLAFYLSVLDEEDDLHDCQGDGYERREEPHIIVARQNVI